MWPTVGRRRSQQRQRLAAVDADHRRKWRRPAGQHNVLPPQCCCHTQGTQPRRPTRRRSSRARVAAHGVLGCLPWRIALAMQDRRLLKPCRIRAGVCARVCGRACVCVCRVCVCVPARCVRATCLRAPRVIRRACNRACGAEHAAGATECVRACVFCVFCVGCGPR